jgi:5-formyltetrahydrofolate cyclo-ligase
MREARRNLDAATQRRNAQQLMEVALRQSWFQASRRLALYWAIDGEMNLYPLLKQCWRLGKQVYLPTISGDHRMSFRLHGPNDPLCQYRYHIMQPSPSAPAIRVDQLDIVFAPLVAFTAQGNRLGMGGGYYDRALAGRLPRRSKPRLIGVAHDCQRVSVLPEDSWDVRMQLILTESGIQRPAVNPSGSPPR